MIGNLISAGASLVGGLLGKKSAEKAQEANQNLQREFAQSGITWKVEDAKRAGIHPIYALGAPTVSASNAYVGDTAMPNALAAAGQDIGRAVNATRSAPQRADAFAQASQKLALEKGSLENEILKLDIASRAGRLRQAAAPAMPLNTRYLIPGQAQTAGGPLVKDEPLTRTASNPAALHQEPGAVSDVGYSRTSGGAFPTPSKDVKERIEDNWYQETMHFVRNNLLPMISPAFNDPPHAAPKGKAWVYDPVYGYKLVPDQWHRKFFRN